MWELLSRRLSTCSPIRDHRIHVVVDPALGPKTFFHRKTTSFFVLCTTQSTRRKTPFITCPAVAPVRWHVKHDVQNTIVFDRGTRVPGIPEEELPSGLPVAFFFGGGNKGASGERGWGLANRRTLRCVRTVPSLKSGPIGREPLGSSRKRSSGRYAVDFNPSPTSASEWERQGAHTAGFR